MLQVRKEDTLPKDLCKRCIEDLTRSQKLIDKYLRSEQIVMGVLKQKVDMVMKIKKEVDIKQEDTEINDVDLDANLRGLKPLLQWDHSYTDLTLCYGRCSTESNLDVDIEKQDKIISGRAFGCNYCYKTFKELSVLASHSCIDMGKTYYKCYECQAHFKKWEELRSHVIANHLNKKLHKCGICKQDFGSKQILKIHKLTHKRRGKKYKPPCS